MVEESVAAYAMKSWHEDIQSNCRGAVDVSSQENTLEIRSYSCWRMLDYIVFAVYWSDDITLWYSLLHPLTSLINASYANDNMRSSFLSSIHLVRIVIFLLGLFFTFFAGFISPACLPILV